MKIITTVGTSLFSNWGNKDKDKWDKQEYNETLFVFDGKPVIGIKKATIDLIADLKKFATDKKQQAAAEIASIEKIDPKSEAEIYLICTETNLSRVCAEAIGAYFGERVKKISVVPGLQVKNVEKFKKEGVVNLLNALENIAQGGHYWDGCVLNITGGYKAIVPILTIVGQVKQLPTYYVFQEDIDTRYDLIEIPRMPVSYQTEAFEKYWEDFSRFGTKFDGIMEKANLSHAFLSECGGCLEESDGIVTLNPIGKILWWSYQQQFFFLRTSDEVWAEIERQHEIKRILGAKFCNSEIRSNKTEKKQDHYVFDDGNNDNRLYYFEDNGSIFVYRTFESEEKAKAYINTPFKETQRTEFIKQSIPKRILIQR